ncbi:pilus assembly protein [Sphingomonas sp. S1-29]|uniref:TadE/TadG family type IV pilus assembly protein n=1 Tax=Sphingomonas sp. S1-29 TaxID=2991074 RepID=UPI002240760C|nr:TadE/TadG family type IV pilus assembly protein [Sphingomonas sp. S1-29]UZK70118.1 pilus assembly protein [Sphingomonas sp. S1-29]
MAELLMITCALPGRLARRLVASRGGVALTEFALALPLLLTLSLTGAELTNYIITRMRLSQLALHLADNSARVGLGGRREAKKVNEADIEDLFTGADYQSGELDLLENGRVILSSLEPMATGTLARIRWQRCKGAKPHASSYGIQGDENLNGIGPTGRRAMVLPDGVTMFVEVYYEYTPLVSERLVPSRTMIEIASMMVRERRNTGGPNNGIFTSPGVTPSTC